MKFLGKTATFWTVDEPAPIPEILNTLLRREELQPGQVRFVLGQMMRGECGEAEAAAFLTALRMKGETAGEVAAAALILREHMIRWDPGRAVLDTCGTGGDCSGTFNISTAAAFVVAGAGVPVVKHGNRSVSSKSGSADVLAALGVPIEGDAAAARRCLDRAGLAFCFAPSFHPALKHVGPLRRRLGFATIFNCLGPLANPAGAVFQLLGVGRIELLDLMAGALARLGIQHAFVVHGGEGLDEVSLASPTFVREVTGSTTKKLEWTHQDLDLAPCSMKDLAAADPAASAAMINEVLSGKDGPARRIVLANAAAALLAAERVTSLREGVALAGQSIASGKARQVLEQLRAVA